MRDDTRRLVLRGSLALLGAWAFCVGLLFLMYFAIRAAVSHWWH